MLYNEYNMKGKDKHSRIFYITHSGELLIWLVVVLLFVAASSLGIIFKEKNTPKQIWGFVIGCVAIAVIGLL